LRRIEKEIRIRRETAAGYLRAAGVPIRSPGRWGRPSASDSKPAKEVTTGSGGEGAAKPANEAAVTTGSEPAKPAHRRHAAVQPAQAAVQNQGRVRSDGGEAGARATEAMAPEKIRTGRPKQRPKHEAFAAPGHS